MRGDHRDPLSRGGTDDWSSSGGGVSGGGVSGMPGHRRRRHRGPASAAYSVPAVKPTDYLPKYNISLSGSADDSLADDAPGDNDAGMNGANYFDSADFICREGD